MNEMTIDHLFDEDSNDKALDFEGFTDRDNVYANAIQVQVHVVKKEILQNENCSYDVNSRGRKLASNVSCSLSDLIHLKNDPNQLKNFELDVQSSDGFNLCISNPRSVSAEFFENDMESSFDSRKKRKIKPKLSGNDFVSNTDTLIRGMVSKTLATYNNASDSRSEYSFNKSMNRKSKSDNLNVSPTNYEFFREYSKKNLKSGTNISKTSADQNCCSSISNDEYSSMLSPNCRRKSLNLFLSSDSSSPFKGFENSSVGELAMKPKKRKYTSVKRNLKKNLQDFPYSDLSKDYFKTELHQLSSNSKHYYYDKIIQQPRFESLFDDLIKEKDISVFEEFDLPYYMQMINQSPCRKKFGPFKSVQYENRKTTFYKKGERKKLDKLIQQLTEPTRTINSDGASAKNKNYLQDTASSMIIERRKPEYIKSKKRGRPSKNRDDQEFKPKITHMALAKLSQPDSYPCGTLLSEKPSRKRKLISFKANDDSSDEEFLNESWQDSKVTSANRTINSVLKKSNSPQKNNSVTNEICSDDEDFLPAEVMHLERQLKREQQRVKQKMIEISAKKELNEKLRDYLKKAKINLKVKQQMKIDQKPAFSLSLVAGVDSDKSQSQSLVESEKKIVCFNDTSNKTTGSDKNFDESQSSVLFNDSDSSKGNLQTIRKFRHEKNSNFVYLSPNEIISNELSPNSKLNEPNTDSNTSGRGGVEVDTEFLDSSDNERLRNNKTIIDKAERFNSIFNAPRYMEEVSSLPKVAPTPVHILCQQIDTYQKRRSCSNNSSVLSKLLNRYRAINSNSNLAMLQSTARILNK